MALRPRNRPSTEFSLASIADMVFLLLIFFMLTSSFVNQAGVKIELPQSASKKPSEGRNSVTITEDLQYYWNKEKLSKEEIYQKIKEVLTDKNPENNIITLRTDRNVTMGEAAYFISAVAEYGGSVVLATKKQK